MPRGSPTHVIRSGAPKRAYRRNFVWYARPADPKMLQMYSRGLEFSLVSDRNEQCHPWVLCKDFLHDVVYSVVHDRPIEIYKFSYDPSQDPRCCMRELRLLIGNRRDRSFYARLDGMLDFLGQIESKLRMTPTRVVLCKNEPEDFSGAVMLRASRRWMRSPPMLSLYTLLVRVGMGHECGTDYRRTIRGDAAAKRRTYQPKDAKWLRLVEPGLHKIIRLGDRRIFPGQAADNYPPLDIETVHGQLGIVGFSHDIRVSKLGRDVLVPAWHRLR